MPVSSIEIVGSIVPEKILKIKIINSEEIEVHIIESKYSSEAIAVNIKDFLSVANIVRNEAESMDMEECLAKMRGVVHGLREELKAEGEEKDA